MAEFIHKGKGRWLRIITPGMVSVIAVNGNSDVKNFISDSVQWDTGSMVTCISERLVSELHLRKTGITTISGIENQPRRANTYMVNLEFPNGVKMGYVEVVEAPMPLTDLLVGMDVISECDFHYSIIDNKSLIRVATKE